MNFVRSNNLSLKYQRLTQSGCKDIWIRNFSLRIKKMDNFKASSENLLKI